MAAKRLFYNRFCSEKLIRSLANIAVRIKRSTGNFFLKRSNEYFFVEYMGIKMSPKIPWR